MVVPLVAHEAFALGEPGDTECAERRRFAPEEEMAGMKRAIYAGGLGMEEEDENEADRDEEVEKLQAMMLKMQAVRGK